MEKRQSIQTKAFSLGNAVRLAADSADVVPRCEFCRTAGITTRTYDRRVDIPKIRIGGRTFSPRSALSMFGGAQ